MLTTKLETLLYGYLQLRYEKSLFKRHFYPDGKPRIVMYGADWCPFCKKLREELNANNIDFIEIDVDNSGDKRRMSQTLDIPGYPVMWVGYNRVNGTDLRSVEKVLDRL